MFLLNFLMNVQIASTDMYMATQNCLQNRASLQNYLLNLKQDLWEHLCICRLLAQGHWSLAIHIFSSFFMNLLPEKIWVQRHEILCILEIQTRLLCSSLHKIKMSKQHIFIIQTIYLLYMRVMLTISKVLQCNHHLSVCGNRVGNTQ